MSEVSGGVIEAGITDEGDSRLTSLSDPELIAHSAAVRTRLALTPKSDPGRAEVKAEYDAVLMDYRRRIEGDRIAS